MHERTVRAHTHVVNTAPVPVTDPESGLPMISRSFAQRHNLVSVYDIARRHGVPTRNVSAGLSREGAPAPKAISTEYHYGRRSPLYSLHEFTRWHDGLPGEKPLGIARKSYKVKVVGTRTPTAGRGYVWRDSRRWNPDE